MEFHTRPGTSQESAIEESFAHIAQAELYGLDSIWLAESHFSPDRSLLTSPLVVASAALAKTSRIKVGTAVQVLPLGNPIRMTEEVATVDHIGKGRFQFGVGRSGLPGAYEGYGISYSESRERCYEYLEIMVHAWKSDRFSYTGKFYSYDDVSVVPKPYQNPHPPIRIAATTNDTFSVIGKMGYGLFIGLRGQGISELKDSLDIYKKAWKDAGLEDDVDIVLRIPVYVAETASEAQSVPQKSFMRQFQRLGNQLVRSANQTGTDPSEERTERGNELAKLDWEDVLEERVAVGTYDMVIKRLQYLKDTLSLRGIAAEFNAGELIPRDKMESSLKLFCERVIPAFR